LNGNITSAGLHGAGGIGGLLAVEETATENSPCYWFLYDGNGNVGQIIKASDQTTVAKYEYDPFGNLIAASGTTFSQIPSGSAPSGSMTKPTWATGAIATTRHDSGGGSAGIRLGKREE